MVDSLGLSQESGDLNFKMYQSESLGEKPDYFLFFENNNDIEFHKYQKEIDRNWFLTEAITDLFVTKPAIYITSMSDISLICIICPDGPLIAFNVTNLVDINQLHQYWSIAYSDLQGATIDTQWNIYLWAKFNKVNCAGFSGNQILFPQNYSIPHMDICVHKVFSETLNYTIFSMYKTRNASSVHGFTIANSYISGLNHNQQTNGSLKKFEWILYAVQYKPFNFVTNLPVPGFRADALYKPFSWITWAVISSSAIFLFCSTYISLKILSSSSGFTASGSNNLIWKLFVAAFGHLVDQTTPFNIHKILHQHISFRALQLCWLLWFLISVKIGELYKGQIFSFLTNHGNPNWPDSLDQLVDNTFPLTYTTSFFGSDLMN